MEAIRAIFFNLAPLAAAATAATLAFGAWGASAASARKALAIILLLALALHAVVFLDATLAYVTFPYEGKSVVEGVTLYNAVHYLRGEQPYRPPEEAPFRSMVYPPVHEMALAGVVAALGTSLTAGRLFSLLCALATAAVCAAAVWRRTRDAIATAFGGAFFVCAYGICGHWIEQVRNDALMALLIALGLWLSGRAMEKGRLPVAGGLALLLALYTKQTALFGAAAVTACLWTRSRRDAATWAGGFLGATLAVFLVMQVWSGGWFAFYTLKAPANVGIEWAKHDLAATFFGTAWPALWAAAWMAARTLRGARASDRSDAVWSWAFLLAAPLCVLQSLKWGAALNAFVGLTPILGALGGLALHELSARREGPSWLPSAALAAAVMQVAMISYQPVLPTAEDFAAQGRIREWVRAAPGDVFVSVFSSQVFLNGKEYFGDTVPIGDVAKAGGWRGGALVEKTRAGGFDVMVLRPVIEPADLSDAVKARYVAVERIPMRGTVGQWPYMDVYVPRDRIWRPGRDPE